jgi:hypothetical protein
MSDPNTAEKKVCKRRHSWMVVRPFFTTLTGKPMEALRCRFCDAFKNRRLKQ